ncbi:uncharacterized protein LOC109491175 isoform X2 [Ailuropoda melanoleuca]|uniref:uncharacterized protein LOC109491175 isoform X2 n=1 Tax=Ailuropoda melanoleuca TaxID=9646 RepID=UPI0014942961|nr:uncharacterized protein LOC109491175 isoform X2 [Ailuropoda melanoleuca]
MQQSSDAIVHFHGYKLGFGSFDLGLRVCVSASVSQPDLERKKKKQQRKSHLAGDTPRLRHPTGASVEVFMCLVNPEWGVLPASQAAPASWGQLHSDPGPTCGLMLGCYCLEILRPEFSRLGLHVFL